MTRPVLIAAGAVLLCAASIARAVTYDLPADETPPELADPEAETVVVHCSGCHSLDYVTTQPRGKGAQFWRDTVTKMVTVYKAPLSPEEADAVSAVLAGKFG